MSESSVETTSSGPSLEQLLWGVVERWSPGESPMVADREEFAAHVADAWGGDTPTEEFLAHFFGEDRPRGNGQGASDMAEAIVQASRSRMHVYEFDLRQLEYVVIESDDDKMVVVGEMGQFQFQVDDTVRALIESGIKQGSKQQAGMGAPPDAGVEAGKPRAYFVRSSGEMVAVDVGVITKAISQARSLKQAETPALEAVALRLAPFNPRRTRVMSEEKEARILRQDARLRETETRAFLQGDGSLRPQAGTAASGALALTPPPPGNAEPTVLLLMPDGTLAQPAIGSGTRWRDMVTDWTARAAFISVGASLSPMAIATTDQKFILEGNKVVAVFSGGRTSQSSATAPGAMGLTADVRSAGLVATRSQLAPVRTLSDDELAQAVLNGAQLVSGLSASAASESGGKGFWVQPETVFRPTTSDLEVVRAGAADPGAGSTRQIGSAELDQLLADTGGMPGQQLAQLGQVTGDPWADWALQAGGKVDPTELLLASRTRPRSGAGLAQALGELAVPGAPAGPSGPNTMHIPGQRLMTFRAPDGTVLTTPISASSIVRLAAAGRPDAQALGFAQPEGQSSPAVRKLALAARSGALPASALAALSMALERSASAGGFKLPTVRIDSAPNAIGDGEQLAATLAADAPQRMSARLMGAPQLNAQTAQLVLSMPFPNAGEVHVGGDLAEALQSFLSAPVVPAGGSQSGSARGPSGAMIGGAAAGTIGGGALAMSLSRGPGAGGAALVGGSAGTAAFGASPSAGGSSLVADSPFGGFVVDGAGDFGGLHGKAREQAEQALTLLESPDVAPLLGNNPRLSGLPSLLRTALESSGQWAAGPGAQVPGGLQKFVLSGPFDLPELVGGPLAGAGGAGGAALVAPRAMNPGEDEIEIPMPLWAQMGRNQLSSTGQILASKRAQPGYAPPLGVYRLVTPPPGPMQGGPNTISIAGPTGLSFESPDLPTVQLVGPQARSLGGRFILGRIPVSEEAYAASGIPGSAEGSGTTSRLRRSAVGAPLGGSAGAFGGSEASGSSFGSSSLAGDGGGSGLSLPGAPRRPLGSMGGDGFSQASLVSGAPGGARIPQVPNINLPDMSGLQPVAGAPVPGRPMAGALQSALRFSDNVGSRGLPDASGLSLPSGGSFASGAPTGSLVTGGGAGGGLGGASGAFGGPGQLGSSAGGGLGASAGLDGSGASSGFGSSGQGLGAGAPRGELVSGGGQSPASQAASDVRRQQSGSSTGGSDGYSSGSSGGSGWSAGVPSLVGPSALTGSRPGDPGYETWSYGSTRSNARSARLANDLDLSFGLERPDTPMLPSTLRFRYAAAPLWWSGKVGSLVAGQGAGLGAGAGADVESEGSPATQSLRAGVRSATAAASLWRSIFVSSRAGGGEPAAGQQPMDRGWDETASQMSGPSGGVDGRALAAGAVVGGAAGAAGGKGLETVYLALDGSAGQGGVVTQSAIQQQKAQMVSMQIVAAIPPAPPPLESMGSGINAPQYEPRARRHGHKGQEQEAGGGEAGGQSQSKIEGSVDAVAQRIFHRIRWRLLFDRERFNG